MRTVPVAALALMAVLTGCSSSSDSPDRPSESMFEAETSSTAEFGTRLGVSVDYPNDRVVTHAELRVGERILDADLYPLDGTDPEPPPDPLPLKAGTKVLVEGTFPPACDVPRNRPVFVVRSRTNGGVQTDRFPVANAGDFRKEAERVCRTGPRLRIDGSSTRPDGSFTVELAVTNADESAELVSRQRTSGRTTWRAVRAEVPSGSTATVRIRGTGEGCSHDGPWRNGQVTLGGKVLDPPVEGYDSPC